MLRRMYSFHKVLNWESIDKRSMKFRTIEITLRRLSPVKIRARKNMARRLKPFHGCRGRMRREWWIIHRLFPKKAPGFAFVPLRWNSNYSLISLFFSIIENLVNVPDNLINRYAQEYSHVNKRTKCNEMSLMKRNS